MTNAWDAIDTWMRQHDLQLDLITVWCIAVGLVIWSLVKAYSWAVIVRTQDRTAVGATMKPQKAAEVVMGLSLATLYSLTLVAYYLDWSPEFWTRLALRVFLIVGIAGASVAGLRFARALYTTRNGGSGPPDDPGTVSGLKPDERKVIFWN